MNIELKVFGNGRDKGFGISLCQMGAKHSVGGRASELKVPLPCGAASKTAHAAKFA